MIVDCIQLAQRCIHGRAGNVSLTAPQRTVLLISIQYAILLNKRLPIVQYVVKLSHLTTSTNFDVAPGPVATNV